MGKTIWFSISSNHGPLVGSAQAQSVIRINFLVVSDTCRTVFIMLTAKSVAGFVKTIRFFYLLRLLPFEYDTNAHQFYVTKSRSHLLIWFSLSIYFLGYSVHTTFSFFYRFWHDSFDGTMDFAMHLMLLCSCDTLAPHLVNTLVRPGEIAALLNQLITTDNVLSGKVVLFSSFLLV